MAIVLCTGSNPVLTKTRQLILEQAGHTVVPALNEREIETACSQHNFEVAVLGQSTPPRFKRENTKLIRKLCPSVKVLEIYPPHLGKALDDADGWLEMPPEGPQMLVSVVNALAFKGTASADGKSRHESD